MSVQQPELHHNKSPHIVQATCPSWGRLFHSHYFHQTLLWKWEGPCQLPRRCLHGLVVGPHSSFLDSSPCVWFKLLLLLTIALCNKQVWICVTEHGTTRLAALVTARHVFLCCRTQLIPCSVGRKYDGIKPKGNIWLRCCVYIINLNVDTFRLMFFYMTFQQILISVLPQFTEHHRIVLGPRGGKLKKRKPTSFFSYENECGCVSRLLKASED